MLPTLDDLTKSETALCSLLVHTEGVIEDVGSSAIQVLSLSLPVCVATCLLACLSPSVSVCLLTCLPAAFLSFPLSVSVCLW